MADPHQPHDKLFKAGFSNPADAGAFLRWRLAPALVERIDWDSLRLESGSFIDSQFRHSESDLLFSAPYAGPGESGEERCYFYFLLEHLSTIKPLFALQILRYIVRILEQEAAKGELHHGRLPVVVTAVVVQSDGKWELSPRFADLFHIPAGLEEVLRPFIPDFTVHLLQLAEIPYDAIAGTPAGILTLRTLKAERLGELDGDPLWDEELMSRVNREARDIFERVTRYLMDRGVDKTTFARRVMKIVEPRLRHDVMSIAEQYIQEGLERGLVKGIEQGIERGRVEGQKADILELLDIRFGEVPEGLREAVEGIGGQERLTKLFRVAAKAATLEEFAGAL